MMPGRCFIRAGSELRGPGQTKSHSDPYRTEGKGLQRETVVGGGGERDRTERRGKISRRRERQSEDKNE